MFVIPIDDSLLYVEPVYLEATNTSIPEVKRVIVAYGDKIAYEPTLAEALDAMFGEGAGEGYSGETSGNARKTSSTSASSAAKAGSSRAELIEDAQDAFDKAQEARKDGDWAEYGSYLDKMEKALEKLQ